jgi:translation initiation factor eIF-2B subunit alpha
MTQQPEVAATNEIRNSVEIEDDEDVDLVDDGSFPLVLQDLRRFLKRQTPFALDDQSAMAMPVAAIKALLGVVQRSQANTMMELQNELKQASDDMKQYAATHVLGRSHIALASGCELFQRFITRTFLELPHFEECRQQVLERGELFAGISLAARDRIAKIGSPFIQEGQTVLTHGWSRVVASILLEAAETKHFDIVILEGRPDASGVKAAQFYQQAGIPTTVVLDGAMAYMMESIDICLVGAEGVVENGGIVNKLGTYALATCAHANDKPFYVAAESYKFARLYPLSQRDLPQSPSRPLTFCDTTTRLSSPSSSSGTSNTNWPGHVSLPSEVMVDNPPCDYTPAKFISLLFTDLGVLTPSAVSDELIRLYQ